MAEGVKPDCLVEFLLPGMDNAQKQFSKIYDQYISRIYRFVFLRVNSVDIAQDLTSETFTRAWSSFAKASEEKDKAQVWEFKKVFPKLTKRTLRRDFEKLLGQGLVERVGERNQTFYKLKSVSKTVLI